MRRLLPGLLLFFAAACSGPPQKEIDQAQAAVDAARAAGAEQYAADAYSAAAATLQKAHASVDQRDYRQALSYAIDARQRAVEAERLVPEARVKAVAETAFQMTNDRVTPLETQLRDLETAGATAQELRAPREALASARRSLQEARRLIDAGKSSEATAALASVRERAEIAELSMKAISQHPRPAKGKKR